MEVEKATKRLEIEAAKNKNKKDETEDEETEDEDGDEDGGEEKKAARKVASELDSLKGVQVRLGRNCYFMRSFILCIILFNRK